MQKPFPRYSGSQASAFDVCRWELGRNRKLLEPLAVPGLGPKARIWMGHKDLKTTPDHERSAIQMSRRLSAQPVSARPPVWCGPLDNSKQVSRLPPIGPFKGQRQGLLVAAASFSAALFSAASRSWSASSAITGPLAISLSHWVAGSSGCKPCHCTLLKSVGYWKSIGIGCLSFRAPGQNLKMSGEYAFFKSFLQRYRVLRLLLSPNEKSTL